MGDHVGSSGRLVQQGQVTDTLALMAVAGQSRRGRWDLASQFLLLEYPPAHAISRRETNTFARPFARLAEQGCARIVLAYIKELDIIEQRRSDLRNPRAPRRNPHGAQAADNDAEHPGVSDTISAKLFASCCTRWVLRARTPFGQYVQNSLLATERAGRTSTRLFTIPLPFLRVLRPVVEWSPSRSHWRGRFCHTKASQMFSNLVVIALNFVAGELRLPAPVAALWRCPSRYQTACLKRVVRHTRVWCRDAGATRVAGARSGPAMKTGMQDFIQSLAPICKGLDPYFSFSRVSLPASADVPAPTDVTRQDLPAQLKPFSGGRFLEPSLRLAFLEPRVLAIPCADPS